MGQSIGVVALAGGHLMSDLVIATGAMKRPVPLVIDRSVGGALNAFGTEDVLHADEELALDLQVRFGHGFYTQGGDVNNFGFMVGVNWY